MRMRRNFNCAARERAHTFYTHRGIERRSPAPVTGANRADYRQVNRTARNGYALSRALVLECLSLNCVRPSTTRRDLIYQPIRCTFELLALRLGFLPNSSAVVTIESIHIKCPESTNCKNEDEKT